MRPLLRRAWVVVALFASPGVSAEPLLPHFTVSTVGGETLFDDSERFFGEPVSSGVLGGARLAVHPNRHFAIEVASHLTGSSPEAMARNRRVEFRMLNPEAATRIRNQNP